MPDMFPPHDDAANRVIDDIAALSVWSYVACLVNSAADDWVNDVLKDILIVTGVDQ